MGQFFHRADMEIKSKERRNRKEMKSQEEREKNIVGRGNKIH